MSQFFNEKSVYLIGTYIGIIITYFFGGWTEALQFLMFLVIVDFFTGIYAAFLEGKKYPSDPTKGINSSKGYWGIFKKVLMFVVIAILHRLDSLLGIADGNLSLMVGGIYFYLVNEIVSLLENLARAGVPIPDQLKAGIAALKSKAGIQEEIPIREEGKPIDEPANPIIKEQIIQQEELKITTENEKIKGDEIENGAKG